MAQDDALNQLLKNKIPDIIGGEELILEAGREMIKDELKVYIRKRLEENPELKKEIKDAIGMYFEAKVKEIYANIKLAKASAKLGIEIMPDTLKKDFSKELEKELGSIIDKML
jgi:hypothetical protein